MPENLRRTRIRLLVIGLAAYAIGSVAFFSLRAAGFKAPANIVGGIALTVYLVTWAFRIGMVVRFAIRSRRASAQPDGRS
jgi:cation transporter-like permease